jgi:protein TonB
MTIAVRHPSARSASSVAIAFALSLAVHGGIVAALLWLPGGAETRDAAVEVELVWTSVAPAPTAGASLPAALLVAPPASVRPLAATTRSETDPVAVIEQAPGATVAHVPIAAAEAGAGAATPRPGTAESSMTEGSVDALAASDVDAQRGFVELHVLDWLARHRRYPRAAARAQLEGVVTVAFKLEPDGRISDGRLEGSSGARVLDGAALELLERASPIPGLAQFAMTAPIELRLPIQYRLRRTAKA